MYAQLHLCISYYDNVLGAGVFTSGREISLLHYIYNRKKVDNKCYCNHKYKYFVYFTA
uniref:Uncharacterized protein n=1 Tax=Anguilla anguilla TaxID=7936 RepID=A0A0E9X6B7_ANGAN